MAQVLFKTLVAVILFLASFNLYRFLKSGFATFGPARDNIIVKKSDSPTAYWLIVILFFFAIGYMIWFLI